MKNVLLIINPVSGKQTIKPKLFDITNTLCKAGCNVSLQITQKRNHAMHLGETAFDNGFDTVICCGGDGTLNETLTGILRSGHNKELYLGYIPCGSTNDFADTLGLDSNPIKQVKRIIKNDVITIDTGNFNNQRYFSYIASFGAFSDASYSASQDLKNKVGHFAYILEGLKDITNIKPIGAKIEANGVCYEGQYVFGAVSNTKSVAGLVKLNDAIVDLNDGLFEVLLVKYPENIVDLNIILHGATQSDFDSDMFEFFKAKKISFAFDESVPWSLDGEKESAGKKVEIEAIEKAIKLYR